MSFNMKITNIEIEKRELELIAPVRVSFGTISSAINYFVHISLENGLKGIGEVSNMEFITKVSTEVVVKELEESKSEVIGKDINDFKNIIKDLGTKVSKPALCGYDVALFDLYAKFKGKPLYEVLGEFNDSKPLNFTIGIMSKEDTLKKANELLALGRENIKVKVGSNVKDDIKTINYLMDNTNISLRVDANQGYTMETLEEFINGIDMSRMILIEEPFKAGEYELLAEAQKRWPDVYFLADETVSTVEDAKELARINAVKGFNIKLIKCSGLLNALEIIKIAEKANISSMLGCMSESKVSLSAAAHLVVSSKNVKACDLDAYTFFKKDGGIDTGVNFEMKKVSIPNNIIGIGVK